MRVERNTLGERLGRRFRRREAIRGWLRARRAARHDDCSGSLCDGRGAQYAAASST